MIFNYFLKIWHFLGTSGPKLCEEVFCTSNRIVSIYFLLYVCACWSFRSAPGLQGFSQDAPAERPWYLEISAPLYCTERQTALSVLHPLKATHCKLHTSHYTHCTALCTLYKQTATCTHTVQCTLLHCTLHKWEAVHWTMYTAHAASQCTPYTTHCTLY